jgi:hypothetical protein
MQVKCSCGKDFESLVAQQNHSRVLEVRYHFPFVFCRICNEWVEWRKGFCCGHDEVKVMAEELKDDAIMNALKERHDFLDSLQPDRRKKMIEFQKKIDEALEKVPENERLELIYRMMMNKLDELIRCLTFQKPLKY